jgi:Mechanosensitive ion channel
MKWLFALAALVVGGVVGSIASASVRRILSQPRRPDRVKNLAPAAASVVLSGVLAAAVVTSLSFLDKTALDRLPVAIMNAVPRFLVALVFVLLGNAVASLVAGAASSAMVNATGKAQPRLIGLVRSITVGVFVLLAIAQIGVNTRVVDMAVAGIIGSTALSIALLTGLGGRSMASEIAAGRYVSRIVHAGDTIAGDGFAGVVTNVWGATTELRDANGGIVHVANSRLMAGNLRIERASSTNATH